MARMMMERPSSVWHGVINRIAQDNTGQHRIRTDGRDVVGYSTYWSEINTTQKEKPLCT